MSKLLDDGWKDDPLPESGWRDSPAPRKVAQVSSAAQAEGDTPDNAHEKPEAPVVTGKAGLAGATALSALNVGAQGGLARTMGVLGGMDKVAPRPEDRTQPLRAPDITSLGSIAQFTGGLTDQANSRMGQGWDVLKALVAEKGAGDKFSEGYDKDKHSTDVALALENEAHPVGTFAGGALAGLLSGPKSLAQALVTPAGMSVGGSGQDLGKVAKAMNIRNDQGPLLDQLRQTGVNVGLGSVGFKAPIKTSLGMLGAGAAGDYLGLSPEEKLQYMLGGGLGLGSSLTHAAGAGFKGSAAKTTEEALAPARRSAFDAETALPGRIAEREQGASVREANVKKAENRLTDFDEANAPDAVVRRARDHAERMTQRHAQTVEDSADAIKSLQAKDAESVQGVLNADKKAGNKEYIKDLKALVAEANATADEKNKSVDVAKGVLNERGAFDLTAQKDSHAQRMKLYADLLARVQAKKDAEANLNQTRAASSEKLGGMGRRMAEAQSAYDAKVREGIDAKVAAKQVMATSFPDFDASVDGQLGNHVEALAKGAWRTQALGKSITPAGQTGVDEIAGDYANRTNAKLENMGTKGKAGVRGELAEAEQATRDASAQQASVDAEGRRKALTADHEANMVGKRSADEEKLMSAGETEQAKIDAAKAKLSEAEAARKAVSENIGKAPTPDDVAKASRTSADRDAFLSKNSRLLSKEDTAVLAKRANKVLEEKGLPPLDEDALHKLLNMASKKNLPAFSPEPPSRDAKATVAGRHGLRYEEEVNGAVASGSKDGTRGKTGAPELPLHKDRVDELSAGVPRKAENYSNPASVKASVKAEEARKAAQASADAKGTTTGNPRLDSKRARTRTERETTLRLKQNDQILKDTKAAGATSKDLQTLIELTRSADPEVFRAKGKEDLLSSKPISNLLKAFPFVGKEFEVLSPGSKAYLKERVGTGLSNVSGNGAASRNSVMGLQSILDLLEENPELRKAVGRGKR